jgi:NADPH:quinone reductase-like Zn-dependent oxidoreductase
MRGWRIHRYGGSSALQLDIYPVPQPADGELLLRVTAASVNPIDWKMREGHLRAVYELAFPRVLGRDCAGVVVESRSSAFRPGDRVLGVGDAGRDGTHAEFAIVRATHAAVIPEPVSDADAVHFGVAGTSAWIPLVERAQLKAGQRILIHAGAGGVGTIALQLARHFGAEVLTTCGPLNVAYVKTLGADHAIDYTREDFVGAARDMDVVFDTLGGEAHGRSFAVLKPGGLLVYIITHPVPPPSRNDVRVELAPIDCTTDRMSAQLAFAAAGTLRAQLGQTYSFGDAPAAYDASETGHARGKVVIVYS